MADHQLPISTGFVEVDGSRLQYEIAGEGHPLVLFQGRDFIDMRIWDRQFPVFAQHYQVIRYDIRGYGQSPASAEPFSLIDDLVHILHALNIQKTYLLDLGGNMALDFVYAYPNFIDALILVSPEISPYQSFDEAMLELPAMLERVAPLTEAVRQNDLQGATEFAMQRLMLPSSPRYAEIRPIVAENILNHFGPARTPPPPPLLDKTRFETRAQGIREIRVPTLVLIGDNSAPEIQLSAVMLEKSLPGVQRQDISQAKYLLNIEQPEQFNQAVIHFLHTI